MIKYNRWQMKNKVRNNIFIQPFMNEYYQFKYNYYIYMILWSFPSSFFTHIIWFAFITILYISSITIIFLILKLKEQRIFDRNFLMSIEILLPYIGGIQKFLLWLCYWSFKINYVNKIQLIVSIKCMQYEWFVPSM